MASAEVAGFLPPLERIITLIPLISSTATLTNAISEHIFLTSFVTSSRTKQKQHAEILPSYFSTFFQRGVVPVITYGLVSVTTGLYNYRSQMSLSSGVDLILRDPDVINQPGSLIPDIALAGITMKRRALWYLAGGILAAAHFAWVPLIMPRVKKVVEGKDKEAVEGLEEWLKVARWRVALADFTAWVCFFVAAGL